MTQIHIQGVSANKSDWFTETFRDVLAEVDKHWGQCANRNANHDYAYVVNDIASCYSRWKIDLIDCKCEYEKTSAIFVEGKCNFPIGTRSRTITPHTNAIQYPKYLKSKWSENQIPARVSAEIINI